MNGKKKYKVIYAKVSGIVWNQILWEPGDIPKRSMEMRLGNSFRPRRLTKRLESKFEKKKYFARVDFQEMFGLWMQNFGSGIIEPLPHFVGSTLQRWFPHLKSHFVDQINSKNALF